MNYAQAIEIKEKLELTPFRFRVPSERSELDPIFNFEISSSKTPSVTINLHHDIYFKLNKPFKKETFSFDEDGKCEIKIKYPGDYHLHAKLHLIPNRDSYCEVNIDYGRGTIDQYLLRGSFNLNEPKM